MPVNVLVPVRKSILLRGRPRGLLCHYYSLRQTRGFASKLQACRPLHCPHLPSSGFRSSRPASIPFFFISVLNTPDLKVRQWRQLQLAYRLIHDPPYI